MKPVMLAPIVNKVSKRPAFSTRSTTKPSSSSELSFQLNTTLLLADLSFVSVVTCPVPGKGNFFLEPLAKAGAADKAQIYGQWGLDHGPYFMHGTITGLAIS